MAEDKKNDESGQDPDKVIDSWIWVKDTRGYGSVTVTLLLISFWVTTIAYVLSMFEGEIYGFKLKHFDVAAATSYFGACLATYTARKWTSAKYGTDKS